MAWTLGTYQDRVQALCRYQMPSDLDITVWLNECRQKLQPYAKLEASSYITLVADQKEYTLPADFYESVFVYRQDTTDSDQDEIEPVEDYDRFTKGYRLFAGKLIYQPTPDASLAGKKVYIDYHKRVGRSSDGADLSLADDTFNIDEQFHDIPFLWACYRAKQQDEAVREAQEFLRDFQNRMDEFIRFSNKKRRRKARVVRAIKDWV